MGTPDFFARLGLLIQKDFLDAEFCANYLSEVFSATAVTAPIFRTNIDVGTIGTLVDHTSRKTEQISVSLATELFIYKRLLAIKPMLEQHFNLSLAGCEKPMFYTYKQGSFFAAHQDCSDGQDVPEFIKARRVSIVIFLNGRAETPRPGCYGGGALTFYGLISQPQWQDYGFPLFGEPGMLVAFRSNILHEVKPVTHGERYTIANWFA